MEENWKKHKKLAGRIVIRLAIKLGLFFGRKLSQKIVHAFAFLFYLIQSEQRKALRSFLEKVKQPNKKINIF